MTMIWTMISAAALLMTTGAHAQTLAFSYTVPAGSTPTLQFSLPGMMVTSIIPGPGISSSGSSYIDWTDQTNITDAVLVGSYIEWAFNTDTGVSFDLLSLNLSYSVGFLAPQQVALGYRINNASTFTYVPIGTGAPGPFSAMVDLSAFTGVETAIFRLVGYDHNIGFFGNSLTFGNFDNQGYSIGLTVFMDSVFEDGFEDMPDNGGLESML